MGNSKQICLYFLPILNNLIMKRMVAFKGAYRVPYAVFFKLPTYLGKVVR